METQVMKKIAIEKLIDNDRHGVYRKPNGDMVLLPIRRHHDWLAKEMKLITHAERVDSEEVEKKAEEIMKERKKTAAKMLEKYGEEIIADMPSLFEGIGPKEMKSLTVSKAEK